MDFWLTRIFFQRALAFIYLIGFLVAAFQIRPLVGAHGLLPMTPPAILPLLPHRIVVGVLATIILFLSYRPARNLFARQQMMNASFDPLHLVNTDGAFGSVGKERYDFRRSTAEIYSRKTFSLPLHRKRRTRVVETFRDRSVSPHPFS